MGDRDVTTHDSLYGRRLGDFTLRERLDEGGFGAVYRCEQPMLGREAVVKVLHKRARADDDALERFAREARFASRLDHPYAAHVYAFGIEDDGVVWIAMELVRGVTLRRWLDDRGTMTLEQLVPFFERVCEVVQAAHERGIVHRDLKPANIMVVESGGKLSPKLLDLGVAKLLGEVTPHLEHSGDTKDIELTPDGIVWGSPLYLSPEAWQGLEVGPAADIYALGAIAFEALTGRRPFRGGSPEELAKQHCVAAIPVVGGSLPAGLNRIFCKALAKSPADRYASAGELAAALRAEADAQLVAQIRTAARAWADSGRRNGLLWRDDALAELDRWMLRTTATGMEAREIEFVEASRALGLREAEAAVRRRKTARRVGAWMAGLMVTIIFGVIQGRALYETRIAQQAAENARSEAHAVTLTSEIEQGRAALLSGDNAGARMHLGEAWAMGSRDGPTAFMYARSLQPLRAEVARLPGTGRMWSASWSPNGRWIVTTDDQGAKIWDAVTYAEMLQLPHGDAVYQAVWAGPDRLVTACGDGSVRIWNAEIGGGVRELRLHGKAPRWHAVSVSGPYVAAMDAKGAVAAVWNGETGEVLTELSLDALGWPSVEFSADGRWLAASGGGSVHVVDTATWRPILELGEQARAIAWDPTGPRLLAGGTVWNVPGGGSLAPRQLGEQITAIAWSPRGHRAVIAGEDGTVQVFDVATERIVSQGNHLHAQIASIAFSADGQRVVSAGASGSVAIGDATTGLLVEMLDGAGQQLGYSTFDATGQRVLAVSWDGSAWIWSAAGGYRKWNAPAVSTGYGLFGGVEADGRYLAVAVPGGPTRVWDTAEDRLLGELPEVSTGDPVPFPVVSADGALAAIPRGNAAEVYALPGGRLVRTVSHGAPVTALAFVGHDVASGSADGVVMIGGVPVASYGAGVAALAALPDGRLAVADVGGTVRVTDNGVTRVGVTMIGRVRMLRPSPDGRYLLAVPFHAGKPAPMVLLDVDRGISTQLDGPPVYAARWTARGILSSHADGAARLWSEDGKPRQTYRGGSRFLSDADLSPDGSMVVGGGGAGLLRFWDAATGRELWTLAVHKPYVMGLHFQSGDVITRGIGGGIARWHLPVALAVIHSG